MNARERAERALAQTRREQARAARRAWALSGLIALMLAGVAGVACSQMFPFTPARTESR